MAIKFFCDGSQYRLPRKRITGQWIAECAQKESFTVGDVSFIFCSREKHLEMNRTYLGHDYPTDVITFDYSDPHKRIVSGDIFIDPSTVAENAARFGTSPHEEMLRVLAHGMLHLCGYKDATEAEQKMMRAKENECLGSSRSPGNASAAS